MKKRIEYQPIKGLVINTVVLSFFILCYKVGSFMLNKKGLAFSRYAEYAGVAICAFLAIVFIIQVLWQLFKYARYAENIFKRILSSICIILIFIVVGISMFIAALDIAFMCHPVGVVERESQKMFVYADGTGNLEYYGYHTILIRDKNMRIFEDFGSRKEDDSIETYGIYPYSVYYYDENGEYERSIYYSKEGKILSKEERCRVHA